MIRTGIGQDSHRFEPEDSVKPLMLAGVRFEGCPGLDGNSDADVVLHAVTNAVSGITCVNVLGRVSDEMCLRQGITDSAAYLREALRHLDGRLQHLSISLECARPKISPRIEDMRARLSELLSLPKTSIGITATTGEGLTAFGEGRGIFCTAIATADVISHEEQ